MILLVEEEQEQEQEQGGNKLFELVWKVKPRVSQRVIRFCICHIW